MTVNQQPGERLILPMRMQVGLAEAVGKGSTGFGPVVRQDAAGSEFDAFFLAAEDGNPVFLAAIRSLTVLGFRDVRTCLVRQPHARLNEPQQGLFLKVAPDHPEFQTEGQKYVDSGDLMGKQTCTLTRTK